MNKIRALLLGLLTVGVGVVTTALPAQAALRLSIYERDGWTCQLCMRPVERNGDPFGNWAPSLDHIECQSWVLVPDHSPRNLRLAHRWCNAMRGDESGERVDLATI